VPSNLSLVEGGFAALFCSTCFSRSTESCCRFSRVGPPLDGCTRSRSHPRNSPPNHKITTQNTHLFTHAYTSKPPKPFISSAKDERLRACDAEVSRSCLRCINAGIPRSGQRRKSQPARQGDSGIGKANASHKSTYCFRLVTVPTGFETRIHSAYSKSLALGPASDWLWWRVGMRALGGFVISAPTGHCTR